MTKNTAMTEQEKLSIVESKLRKRRLSAKNTSSLLRQHERLLTKIAGRGPGRPPEQQQQQDPRFAEFTAAQQRVLNRLTGEELEIWEHVYRIENERRAQPKQGSPVLDLKSTAVKPTDAEIEVALNGGVRRTVQAAREFAPGPQADID